MTNKHHNFLYDVFTLRIHSPSSRFLTLNGTTSGNHFTNSLREAFGCLFISMKIHFLLFLTLSFLKHHSIFWDTDISNYRKFFCRPILYETSHVLSCVRSFFLLNIGDENFGFFCAINDYYQIRIWLGQHDGKSHTMKAVKSVEEYKCHKGRKLWIVYRHLFCRFCRYLMTSSILLWEV